VTGGHGSGAQFNLTTTAINALNVTRGINGTTAAAHAAGAPIFLASDQRGLLASSASPSFDIGAVNSGASAAVGVGLLFSVQPPSTTTNSNFNVAVTYTNVGTPVVGATITLTLSSGVLNGTATAVTNSSGVAVFSNLSVPSGGSYSLTAGLAALRTASSLFTISASTTPSVGAASPSSGDIHGGATVVLTGTNFNGATSVLFGSIPATSFTVDSKTQITAVVPAEAAAAVNVSVTTPQGTSVGGGQFNYVSSVTFLVTSTASTEREACCPRFRPRISRPRQPSSPSIRSSSAFPN
jgi:IPT/TIG domain